MMNSRVFVPCEPVRRNRYTGELEPAYDISPAEKFGDLKIILPKVPRGDHINNQVIRQLRDGLNGFNENDYLLCIGSPVVLTCAGIAAAQSSGGRVRFLEWSHHYGDYLLVDLDLTPEEATI